MTANQAALSLLVILGACAADDQSSQTVDDFDPGKADAYTTPRSVYCHTTDAAADLVTVRFTPTDTSFDVAASSADGELFALASQRPSLNVEVEDGTSDVPDEFIGRVASTRFPRSECRDSRSRSRRARRR
jgi:hypothetical protein